MGFKQKKYFAIGSAFIVFLLMLTIPTILEFNNTTDPQSAGVVNLSLLDYSSIKKNEVDFDGPVTINFANNTPPLKLNCSIKCSNEVE